MLNMDVHSLVDNYVAHTLTRESVVMLGIVVSRYIEHICRA